MNKKKTLLLGGVVAVAFLLICICGVFGVWLFSSKALNVTKKPPHYGVFIQQNGDLLELREREIFHIPREDEANDAVMISGSQPVIVYWRDNVNLNYLTLYKLGKYNSQQTEVKYNATPQEDGIFEIKPANPLEDGIYCLVQGDLLSAFLPGWCFKIGTNESLLNQETSVAELNTPDPLQEPVAVVESESITGVEFVMNVRYQRARIIENYQQLSIYFGDDQQFQQQLQQTLNDVQGIGRDVLDNLIEDRLIRLEANRRGITVTDADVDKAIKEAFGYYPDGQPTATPTIEPIATSTLTSLQKTLTAPIATPIQLPAAPTASGVLTPAATATPYTEDAFIENYKAQLEVYQDASGMSEKDFRFIIESQLYRDKVREAVLGDMNILAEEEQVWVRHILVSDLVSATMILEEINNGGDFAQLAQRYSQDTVSAINGGDLGWFGKGKMDPVFEQAAWALKVGEVINQPVKSQFGYHIIQVLGHATQPLNDSEYQYLRQQKFNEWLAQKRQQANVKIYDLWKSIVPDDPRLPSP